MSRCAWCETATPEALAPGRRGAFVHPSCEAARRGRRSFLIGAATLVGAALAAPLLDLVPEAQGSCVVTEIDHAAGIVTVDGAWVWYAHPTQLEAVRRSLPSMLPPDHEGPGPITMRDNVLSIPPGRSVGLVGEVIESDLVPPGTAYLMQRPKLSPVFGLPYHERLRS